jgi:hypothetical protein
MAKNVQYIVKLISSIVCDFTSTCRIFRQFSVGTSRITIYSSAIFTFCRSFPIQYR